MPSRSAHGQISSSAQVEQVHHRVGDQRAGDQLVRPARGDPGQLGRPRSAYISSSFGTISRSTPASSTRRTTGRRADGAAPQIRASERNVFEVATAWSGAAPGDRPGVAGRCRPGSCAAARGPRPRRARRRGARGSAAPAPSGSDCATSGASSEPTAISSEPPPMSKTASRPEDQPNQRRTARKVSRASSSPGQHLDVDAGPVPHARRGPRRRSPRRGPPRSRRPTISSQPLSSATTSDEATNSVSASTPASVTAPVVVEVLGQPQRLLVGVRRHRRRAAVASTTSRCPVLEPMSSTPNLHEPAALVARRRVCRRA